MKRTQAGGTTARRDQGGHAHTPNVPAVQAPQAQDLQDTDDRYAHIHGWGADLDHQNRPAYPMERTPPRLDGAPPGQPEEQQVRIKVYHSVERPGITPIFGTSTPPSGLSGKVRDVAYTFSENDLRHWLLLLFADRVNMVEGVIDDLRHGKMPNVLAEMGIRAEWQHNRAGLVRKIAIVSAVSGLAYLMLTRRKTPH